MWQDNSLQFLKLQAHDQESTCACGVQYRFSLTKGYSLQAYEFKSNLSLCFGYVVLSFSLKRA
jgi:hypothetical protein